MTDEFATLDATAQAELVARGEASATELVDAAIARIEALNPTLNAVIHTDFERARDAAGKVTAPTEGSNAFSHQAIRCRPRCRFWNST